MTIAVASIPAELRARPQWCCWRYIRRGDDKPTKVPFQPDGRPAKSDDPSTWRTFGEVVEANGFSGIGYVFSADDPYVGIDLDNALADGTLKSGWAKLVERFGTYTEVSPSGKGVKLWVKGRWPGVQSDTGKRVGWRDGQIEAYWRGRYFAVTGQLYRGCPSTIAENQAAIDGLYRTILNPAPKLTPLTATDAANRCIEFLRRIPDAVSGQRGHDRTFQAACECWKFGLTESDAMSVMRWWSAEKCQPPWTDKELLHKLDNARGKVVPAGEFGKRIRSVEVARVTIEAPPDNATALDCVVDDMIEGRRVNVPWPWRVLTDEARALLPGTMTVLSGVGGASKSLMISQACLQWLSAGVPFAVFHLEEDREYHELRALAQLAANSRITQDTWARGHGDELREVVEQHRATLDALGRSVWDAPASDVTLGDLTEWVRERVRDGRRIVVVDPVTAADSGSEPWAADRRFVLDCKRALRESGSSLIVVTHPRDGNPRHGSQIDNHAGGQAYNRFTQCVLMLGACEPERASVKGEVAGTTDTAEVNRVLRVCKSRNGPGTGKSLGYWFDGQSLRFVEQGEIEK